MKTSLYYNSKLLLLIKISFYILLISSSSGWNRILAQSGTLEPTVLISIPSERIRIYDNFNISWKCTDPSAKVQENELQNRYKLDVPGDWMGGIKYNINKWSDYIDGISGNVIYSNFILEGNYRISVQCRNKVTGKESKVFSKAFKVYWEYPEIKEEAFKINWQKVNSTPSQKEKYQLLSEEYKNSYLMWYQKFQYEINAMHTLYTADEIISMVANSINESFTEDALVSMLKQPSQAIVKRILLTKTIYDIIKLGTTDLILIYRNVQANKALSMAAVSYKAWKLFEKKAK